MQDVARHARLHKSTVSLALRNDPRIPRATQLKVQAAAEALGYKLNPLVANILGRRRRRLGSHISPVLAFVNLVPETWFKPGSFFERQFLGARNQARLLDLELERFDLGAKGLDSRALGKILRARGIRGAIIGPSQRAVTHLRLPWEDLAAVHLGAGVLRPALHQCHVDFSQALSLTFKQLRRRGCRRIGLAMAAESDRMVSHRWFMTYAFLQSRLPKDEQVEALTTSATASQLAAWLLKEKPDALVSYEHFGAERFTTLGLRVPEDLAFAALNVEEGSTATGVNCRAEELGAAAVDLLVSSLQINQLGIPATPRHVTLEATWSEGRTPPPRPVQPGGVDRWKQRLERPWRQSPTRAGWKSISLKAAANRPLHSPQNAWLTGIPLPRLPETLHLYGIPFRHSGKAVVFASRHRPDGLARLRLPVGRPFRRLCLLQACAWPGKAQRFGSIEVAFAHGRHETIPLTTAGNRGDENATTHDWWPNSRLIENRHIRPVVLHQKPEDGHPGYAARLYVLEWANPSPRSAVAHLNIQVDPGAEPCWGLVAATIC